MRYFTDILPDGVLRFTVLPRIFTSTSLGRFEEKFPAKGHVRSLDVPSSKSIVSRIVSEISSVDTTEAVSLRIVYPGCGCERSTIT